MGCAAYLQRAGHTVTVIDRVPPGRSTSFGNGGGIASTFVLPLAMPGLMKKYQTEDERQLLPARTVDPFLRAGFTASASWFDFCSTPLAGLFPSWAAGYRLARRLDQALTACPGVRAFSSNFELIAYRPRMAASIST